MKKFKVFFITVILSCMCVLVSKAAYYCTSPEGTGNTKVTGTFTETDQGRRFTGADGQVYVNHWLYHDNGTWYYFDQNGYAVTGFQTIDGKRRFFSEKFGQLKKNKFVYGGYVYWGDSNTGEIVTSLNGGNDKGKKYNSILYTFDAEGHATPQNGIWDPGTLRELRENQTNGQTWKKEKQKWVYYENGTKLVNAWHEEGGYWFYFDENGIMVTNSVRDINGQKYSFGSDGSLKADGKSVTDNGNSYIANADGTLTLTKTKEEADAEAEAKRRLSNDYGLNTRQQYLNSVANPYMNNPVVQWFNATYAVLTRGNGQNIKAVGGSLKMANVKGMSEEDDAVISEYIKKGLSGSWGVTNRASADKVLNSLIISGNVTGSAWDYSRAMSNLGYYYIAGYYTIEETLNQSLEIAKVIQTRFSSWDEFNESYLKGYTAWSGKDDTERRNVYNNLKGSLFNPFALDWNMKLEKNW